MKIVAWIVSGVVGLTSPAYVAMGQPLSPSEPPAVLQGQVSFQFERTGLAVPRYTVEVHEDGTGRYQADEAEAPPNQSSSAVRYAGGKHVDRAMTLSPATVAKTLQRCLCFEGEEHRRHGEEDAELCWCGWPGLVRLQLLREQERRYVDGYVPRDRLHDG